MSSELVAALVGAGIGFLGSGLTSWLVQASQYRRQRLEKARQLLGLGRGLRAELAESRLLLSNAMKQRELVTSIQFPVALWETDGHRLLATFRNGEEADLVDAFGRLR